MISFKTFRERYRWMPAIAGLAFLILHSAIGVIFRPMNIHEVPALLMYAWFFGAIFTLSSSMLFVPKWQSFVGFSAIILVFWNIVTI